jgi:hypothetical protein
MDETEHELPCGHALSTSSLLQRVCHFVPEQERGSIDCLVCGKTSVVEFARMDLSDGTRELPATFVSTGTLESAPGIVIAVHQRRRVRGLLVEGRHAHWDGRTWEFSVR